MRGLVVGVGGCSPLDVLGLRVSGFRPLYGSGGPAHPARLRDWCRPPQAGRSWVEFHHWRQNAGHVVVTRSI